MKRIFVILTVAAAFGSASALIIETEPNNSIATADVITRGPAPWVDIGILALDPAGDNDFFSITLTAGETITAITTPLQTMFTDPDTVMALINPAGTAVLVSNDDIDGANNRGSAWAFNITTAGTYFIGITGFHSGNQNDVAYYSGSHTEDGSYQLMVGVVPEPATLTALGLGLAALLRRRRK